MVYIYHSVDPDSAFNQFPGNLHSPSQMSTSSLEIANLTGRGLSRDESRQAATWMAKAFALARTSQVIHSFLSILKEALNEGS